MADQRTDAVKGADNAFYGTDDAVKGADHALPSVTCSNLTNLMSAFAMKLVSSSIICNVVQRASIVAHAIQEPPATNTHTHTRNHSVNLLVKVAALRVESPHRVLRRLQRVQPAAWYHTMVPLAIWPACGCTVCYAAWAGRSGAPA